MTNNTPTIKPTEQLSQITIWQRLFEPHPSIKEVGIRRQAQLISIISLILASTNLIGALASYFSTRQITAGLVLITLALISGLGYSIARTRYYRVGGYLVVWLLTASAFANPSNAASISDSLYVYLIIAIVFASISFPFRYMVFYVIFCIVAIPLLPFFYPDYVNVGFDLAIFFPFGILILTSMRYRDNVERDRLNEAKIINRELEDLTTNLEKRIEERTIKLAESTKQMEVRASQLEAIAYTARTTAMAQSLDQLLNTITQDVSERFGFYHVGVFLLDNNKEYASLQSANSEGGRKMLARGHRLKVGAQGIVGFVTLRGEPRIALNVGQDAVFFNNPDLPNTRSELALPLKIGETILGALDLQSIEENAFTQADVSVLSILADQVAIAIQNARSSEKAQRALEEADLATKQLSGKAWAGYAKTIQSKGYRYDGVKSEALKEASVSRNEDGSLSIPVQLRGQTIGRLKLKASDATRNWTEDERAIIESTAERVAIAMEGARLLEEAQKRAARESFLSDVGAKLGTSFQLDSILRDTVEELGQNLQGSTVSFQLINPSAPPTADSPKADGASARRKKAE